MNIAIIYSRMDQYINTDEMERIFRDYEIKTHQNMARGLLLIETRHPVPLVDRNAMLEYVRTNYDPDAMLTIRREETEVSCMIRVAGEGVDWNRVQVLILNESPDSQIYVVSRDESSVFGIPCIDIFSLSRLRKELLELLGVSEVEVFEGT